MILPKTKKPKIFVTTGSAVEFDILIKKIDNINKNNKYFIIIQVGKGNYIPKHCKYFSFDKSLDKYYKWGDLVITHTGAGTLTELIVNNKKVISISNPKTVDNHAIAIKLDEQGYIKYIPFKDVDLVLEKIIFNIINNKIKFKKYIQKKETIGKEILKYIYK